MTQLIATSIDFEDADKQRIYIAADTIGEYKLPCGDYEVFGEICKIVATDTFVAAYGGLMHQFFGGAKTVQEETNQAMRSAENPLDAFVHCVYEQFRKDAYQNCSQTLLFTSPLMDDVRWMSLKQRNLQDPSFSPRSGWIMPTLRWWEGVHEKGPTIKTHKEANMYIKLMMRQYLKSREGPGIGFGTFRQYDQVEITKAGVETIQRLDIW